MDANTPSAPSSANPSSATADRAPIAYPASGAVLGARTAEDIQTFFGIPYAAPPVGALRWRAPQPHPVWTAVRDATAFGPSAPQAGPLDVADIVTIGGAPEPTSEDCLTLNIWTPCADTDAEKAVPVMVWLHGGSNRMGAGSLAMYDGSAFARDGVVLVTVNYRLGHLGFFAHPALSAEAPTHEPLGNQGLLDQIAALRWVQDNIAAFGGDPANVTVFGESAGGIDIQALLTAARARGLFAKAVIQSGAGWLPAATLKKAEANGVAAAVALGLMANATASDLRSLTPAQLTSVAGAFNPVIDGRLLDRDPISAFASGRFADVPLMMGANSGEDSLLNYGGGLARFGTMLKPTPKTATLYPEAKGDEEKLIRSAFREFGFTAPARWLMGRWNRHAKSKNWLYYFDYVEEARRPAMTGAWHGSEIFHVFETLDHRPDGAPAATDADRAVSKAMHDRWVAFAKTGAPGENWPVHTGKNDAWMVFGAEPGGKVQHGLLKAQIDAHGSKSRLLITILRARDRLTRLFGFKSGR